MFSGQNSPESKWNQSCESCQKIEYDIVELLSRSCRIAGSGSQVVQKGQHLTEDR